MRVISGSARGRRLKELQGMDTRPTTDKVKESLFNIIQFEIEGRSVLDLFGGTGQLGIEALSRGAERCTFVDARREAAALIPGEPEGYRTGEGGPSGAGGCDLLPQWVPGAVWCHIPGPPYQTQLLEQTLELVSKIDILSEHGIMICESPAERELPPLAPPYEKGREYRYGRIKLTVYRRQGSDPRP